MSPMTQSEGAVSGIVLRMRSCVLFWTRDSSTKVIGDVSQEGTHKLLEQHHLLFIDLP
jgi:hypothetical protein